MCTPRPHTARAAIAGTVKCAEHPAHDPNMTPPADLGPVVRISVANLAVCAMKLDGALRCWGSNSRAQLNIPCGLAAIKDVSVSYNDVRSARAAPPACPS